MRFANLKRILQRIDPVRALKIAKNVVLGVFRTPIWDMAKNGLRNL